MLSFSFQLFGAAAAFSIEGDVNAVCGVPVRKAIPKLVENFLWEFDVLDFAAFFAVEVGVRGEVGAVAGGLALEVDWFDESAGGEALQAVVNGGEGDGGHVRAGAGIDFVGSGVIGLLEEDREDVFALPGRAQAASLKGTVETFPVFGGELDGSLGQFWL